MMKTFHRAFLATLTLVSVTSAPLMGWIVEAFAETASFSKSAQVDTTFAAFVEASFKKIPSLTLPEIEIETFAAVPPLKETSVTPKLQDVATTSDRAINYKEVMEFLGVQLSDAQKRFLDENKFLLIPKRGTRQTWEKRPDPCAPHKWDEMMGMFDTVCGEWDAIFRRPENTHLVTPDVVLHAFHKFFENSLKYLEKNDLARTMHRFVRDAQTKVLEYKEASGGKLSGHYETIAAQFTVALVLLENSRWESMEQHEVLSPEERKAADSVDTLANAKKLLEQFRTNFSPPMLRRMEEELTLIYEAKAVAPSPLFGQYSPQRPLEQDYTQFRPRSHYAGNSVLRAYFRAMMYFGRNGYLLDNEDGITDALLVAHLLASAGPKGRPIVTDWQRIMDITGFYAGQSDAICYPEWRDFLAKALGTETFAPEEAVNPEVLKKISQRISELRSPRISSEIARDESDSRLTKEERLQKVKALRIFGRRFTFDAWMFTRLTGGLEQTDVRLPSMPSALFVPAVFDDKTAREFTRTYLKNYSPAFSDQDIAGFFTRVDEVASDIRKLKDSDWFGSLGSAWLMLLRPLTVTFGEGYPLYMRSKPFPVKQLQTFLGSYTELKHDTLLYVEQNMAECGGPSPEGTPPPVPNGFVEPNLPFWLGLERLVNWAYAGFEKHGLFELDREKFGKLGRFRDQVKLYTEIATKELQGKPVTEEEYEQLRVHTLGYMAEPFEDTSYISEEEARSGLIADIHTDIMKNEILYEATGEPYVMLALVGNENSPRLTIGVVFNHYEFTGPLGPRLSDAEWRKTVYDNPSDLPRKSFWYDDLLVK